MGVFQEKFFLGPSLARIFVEQFNELREVIHRLIVVRRPARVFFDFFSCLGRGGWVSFCQTPLASPSLCPH
jgi:hypothetical protein